MSDDRLALAHRLQGALGSASPGSTVELRGSLAAGTADEFSDIDLLWTVPEHAFAAALGASPAAIASVAPLLSLRSDPDWQASPSRRLLFARLTGVPLWWRLDLEVRAVGSEGSPATPGHLAAWDPYESALQNALATIKAIARGQEDQAEELMTRACARISSAPIDGSHGERVIALAETIALARPHLRSFADGVIAEAASRL